jgi:hypothetical protein
MVARATHEVEVVLVNLAIVSTERAVDDVVAEGKGVDNGDWEAAEVRSVVMSQHLVAASFVRTRYLPQTEAKRVNL